MYERYTKGNGSAPEIILYRTDENETFAAAFRLNNDTVEKIRTASSGCGEIRYKKNGAPFTLRKG